MGKVNGKGMLQVGDAKVIALEMWRSGSFGPVNYAVAPGIHLWATKPINFSSIVIRSAGVRTHLSPTAVYNKDNLPTANNAQAGNANNAVRDALTATAAGKYFFPSENTTGTAPEDSAEIPNTTTVYWFRFPDVTKTETRINASGATVSVTVPNPVGVNARKIFPRRSRRDAGSSLPTNISSTLSVYFK